MKWGNTCDKLKLHGTQGSIKVQAIIIQCFYQSFSKKKSCTINNDYCLLINKYVTIYYGKQNLPEWHESYRFSSTHSASSSQRTLLLLTEIPLGGRASLKIYLFILFILHWGDKAQRTDMAWPWLQSKIKIWDRSPDLSGANIPVHSPTLCYPTAPLLLHEGLSSATVFCLWIVPFSSQRQEKRELIYSVLCQRAEWTQNKRKELWFNIRKDL